MLKQKHLLGRFYNEYLNNLDTSTTKIDLSNHKYSKKKNIIEYDFSKFSNLEELNLSGLQITKLPSRLPITLKKLIISSNNFSDVGSLDNLINLVNLEYLDCSHSNITKLDNLPPNLKILICRHNAITRLENLPLSLLILDCSNNLIETLDFLPLGLLTLNCGYNPLTELANLPPGLKFLDCSKCNIESLDTVPDSIETMYCRVNKIKRFSRLPASLKELSVLRTPLTYPFQPTLRNILDALNEGNT